MNYCKYFIEYFTYFKIKCKIFYMYNVILHNNVNSIILPEINE